MNFSIFLPQKCILIPLDKIENGLEMELEIRDYWIVNFVQLKVNKHKRSVNIERWLGSISILRSMPSLFNRLRSLRLRLSFNLRLSLSIRLSLSLSLGMETRYMLSLLVDGKFKLVFILVKANHQVPEENCSNFQRISWSDPNKASVFCFSLISVAFLFNFQGELEEIES